MDRIDNSGDFFRFLKENLFQTRELIFRGQRNYKWELLTGISRNGQAITGKKFEVVEEKKMVNSYIKKSYPYIDRGLINLEELAIAQHHGLPTRLLDWTWNPLVAAYFAAEIDENVSPDKDGVIFYCKVKGIKFINPMDKLGLNPDIDPFDVKDNTILYEPKFVNQRITAQSSLFSLHHNPFKDIINQEHRIKKIVISKKIKEELGIALETMGIHAANLFPGLEGTAKHIKWLYTY